MTPGEVVLIRLRSAGGAPSKIRSALVLASPPGPYQNVLLSGISTQLQQLERDWDELIQTSDADFASSGLRQASAVRLSFLYAADATEILGSIGRLDATRLARLRSRLAKRLE